MILVVSATGDVLTLKDLKAMKLPARHGWEAWLHKDRAGKTHRCASYALALALERGHRKPPNQR